MANRLAKRVLLGWSGTKEHLDFVLGLLRKNRPRFLYDVREAPDKDNPAKVMYEIYATTLTDWRCGRHKDLLAYFTGINDALYQQSVDDWKKTRIKFFAS